MKRNTSFRFYKTSLTAKAGMQEAESVHKKYSKGSDGQTIENVSVEEWDCPQPGKRKYLPKTVKENIRKNLKKVNAKDRNIYSIDSSRTVKTLQPVE